MWDSMLREQAMVRMGNSSAQLLVHLALSIAGFMRTVKLKKWCGV